MPLFARDGVNFHYLSKGSGTPFFFQHGLGADVSQPFGLFQPPSGYLLLAFDCRAHGLTVPLSAPQNISLSAFADDLLALMDHLQIGTAIVGGISMGAAVALNFVCRFPARALGLILSRPAWLDRPNPWNVGMFGFMARLVREHGADCGRRIFLESDEYLNTRRDYPETAQSLARQFDNPRLADTMFCLERIPPDAPNRDRADWQNIQVPTLVLANRLDPIHPFDYGEVLARSIPGAEFREITPKSVSAEQHGRDVQQCLEEFLRCHESVFRPQAAKPL